MMDNKMTDNELDKLLAAVRQPQAPDGFALRLQAKLLVETSSNVIAFPTKKVSPPPTQRIWLSAIPLAASLALGVYLGAMGSLSDSLSGLEGTLISDVSESFSGTGVEDTESFLNGDLS